MCPRMKLLKSLSYICGRRGAGRLVFFILAVYLIVPTRAFSVPTDLQPALMKFFTKAIMPVIGDKRANMKYKVYSQGDQLLLLIEGVHQGLPLSRYIIRFGSEDQTFAIPKLELVTKQLPNRQAYAQLTGELTLSAKQVLASPALEEETKLARLLLRADPLLLPQLNIPGAPKPATVTLTDPQQTLLSEVQTSIQQQRADGKAPRALIFLPTGIGKTVLAALTTKDQNSQQIFFVVENKEVLRDATEKFIQLLNISREDTAILNGDFEGNKIAALKSKKVVAITRTGLFNALSHFAEHLDQRHTPATFIFDEAQHLGRKDGQFDKIIAAIEQHLKTEDLILGLSATPWHVETDFVRRFFSPNIFSMFLNDQEREQVLQNKNLVQLSMTMVLRAMSAGYINPIFAFDEITTVPDLKDISVRALLKRDEMTLGKMTTDEAVDYLTKQISVHQPLIVKMLHEIMASVDRSEEHTYYWNRGLIFVPSIAHANVYSFMLNRLRKNNPSFRVEFEAYHSKLDPEEADQVMDWFKDEEVRGYKKQHKYLIVVRSAGEGFDFPAINHLITAKPYNKEDQIGVRELLQNLGRATRLAPFKTQLRVTDFTGDMRRLFADLDSNLLRSFPALDTVLKSPAPSIETEIVLTTQAPQTEELVTETVDVAKLVAAPKIPVVKEKTVVAEKQSAPEAPKPQPIDVPGYIQAELEAQGAASPFDFMIRNISKFKLEGYLDNEKRLAHLRTQMSENLALFFVNYIRSVSGSREYGHHYTWQVYYKQLEALAKLRYPGTRFSYLFQTERALDEAEFKQFESPFDREQFIKNVGLDTFLATYRAKQTNRERENAYLNAPMSNKLFIPATIVRHVELVEKFVEKELLSIFDKSTFTKIDLIQLPLQEWPERWRSETRRMTREPNILSNRTQEAANLAGIRNLQDFLIQYYNQDFADSLAKDYWKLVEQRSPLMNVNAQLYSHQTQRRPSEFFLSYGGNKESNRAAIFISLAILAKNVNAGVDLKTIEFDGIYFLVSELIARSRMLGIHSYLTTKQVEQLSQMTSNGCEIILAPREHVVKKEKLRRTKPEPYLRPDRFI